ncbi:MAG: hypothetical protein GX643_13420 [Acidimicrobiales bacterium]|nr:hypothetical protein [Acidimicrobiales bacterium]
MHSPTGSACGTLVGMEPEGLPAAEIVPLLSVPQTDFVAARTARVKELKAAGDGDLARTLAGLRKPTRLVWVVGQIAREDPELAGEAVAAAEDAEAATTGAGDVRTVLESFRAVVTRVTAAVAEVDPTADRSSVGLALREVLSDPTARREWALGCLLALPSDRPPPTDELAPRRARREAEKAAAARQRRPGSDDLNGDTNGDGDGSGDGADRSRHPSAETAAERKARKAEEAARAARRREHERAVAKGRKRVADLDGRRVAADEAVASAQADLDDLEARLADLEAEVEIGRARLTKAESRLDEADTAFAEAQAQLDELEQGAEDDG